MKRYQAIPLLAALSVAAFVGGYRIGARAAQAPAVQALTLTIHTSAGTYTVQSTYAGLMFGGANPAALAVDYTSDRIFCSGFQPLPICAEALP